MTNFIHSYLSKSACIYGEYCLIENQTKRGGLYLLSLLILYCLAVMSIFPPVRALPIFNYIWPVFVLAWILTVLIESPGYFIRSNFHQLIAYLFFSYAILIAFISGNGFIGNRFLEYFQILIFYWAYRLNEKKGMQQDSVRLLLCLLPVFVFTSILTVTEYVANPNISRTAKKDTLAGIEQMSEGIAGYEFIYFLVFSFASILYLVVNKKSKFASFKKIIWLIILGLIMTNIVLSNFMIALLLMFVSVVFRFLIPKISAKRIIVYTIAAMAIIPFLPEIFLSLIEIFLNMFGSSMNAQRLIELRELLAFGLVELSLGARLDAFNASIQAIISNPIIGIITSDIGGHGEGLSGFGQHSFLLDTFALYGVVFGAMSVYVFFQPLVRQLNHRTEDHSSLPLLMILLCLIFFIVNNMTPSVGFAIYFVFPVIYSYIINVKALKQPMATRRYYNDAPPLN